jgi:hypothetical protein
VEGRGYWNIREVGSPDGDPASVARILKAAAPEALRAGNRRVYGWLPGQVAKLLPGWRPVIDRRRRAIPMILPLQGRADLSYLEKSGAVNLMFMDQF